jgi:MFS transporter, DHA1 family, multidrug resistance protein
MAEPEPTQTTAADEREHYYRRNIGANFVVESMWGFACALITTTTIMTVFLERLGASKTIIGGYPGALLVGFALFQIPAARWATRLKYRLRFFFLIHLVPCTFWLVMAGFTSAWGLSHPHRLMWLVIGLNALYSLILGAVMPMWLELASRFFPDNRRGQAFGIMTMGIGLFGCLGAWYSQHILDTRPFPDSFAHLFLVACVVMIGGLLPYLACKEVAPDTPAERTREGYFAWLRRFMGDRRLQRFIISRYLFETGASAGVFYAVYAIEHFHMRVAVAGTFTLLSSGARAIVSPVLGRLGDRRGYRRITALGMIFAAGSTAVALVATTGEWFYVVFIFQAMLANGDIIGVQNLLIEMCPEEDKTPYSAVFNSVMMPVRFLGPLAAGILADRVSIPLVFAIGLAMQCLGLIYMLAFVDDPRRPGRRVLASALTRFNEIRPW